MTEWGGSYPDLAVREQEVEESGICFACFGAEPRVGVFASVAEAAEHVRATGHTVEVDVTTTSSLSRQEEEG